MSAVTILVLVAGLYLTVWSNPQKINEVRARFDRFNREAQQLDIIEAEFLALENSITEKRARLSGHHKKFVKDDSFAKTYDYLNSILKYIGFLDFNMIFVKTEKAGDLTYNIYSIRGEGPFLKVFQFINYIEKGPQLYQLEKLNLQSSETRDDKSGATTLVIMFQMEMRAYSMEFEDIPPVQASLGSVRAQNISNPFYPVIFRDLPSNADNLMEVERMQVKAIMTDKAMVEFGGKMHVLKVGDRVYLGHLSQIIPENNELVFVLNKGGIVERQSLKLEFGGSKK
jgi:hypothetical protein